MRWTFWCSPEQADHLAERLCSIDFIHFTRSSLPVKARAMGGGRPSLPVEGKVLGEFVEIYSGDDAPELPASVQALVGALRVGMACVTRDETDGQTDWKQYFTPQHIEGVCDVVPPWEWSPLAIFSKVGGQPQGADVLVIEPEMAFGTGSHPTTQLGLQALAWLRRQDPPNPWTCLLDAGTGSGIISLYGRKMGVPFIVACDVDEQVFPNLEKNFEGNHARVPTLVRGDVTGVYGTFDWVFVNISAEIILTQMAHVCGWVRSGGYLFLSGFQKENESGIGQALKKSSAVFRPVWTQTREDWVGVLLKKFESASVKC